MDTLHRGQGAGLLAAALFGCSAPLVSTFTRSGSALSIAALLYAGATLALLAVRLIQGPSPDETPLQRQDWPALAGLTLLGGIVGPVALVHGLAQLPAASSSLLLNLEGVFTLTIAVLVGREHLGRRGLASAALTLGGAVLLSGGSLAEGNGAGAALIAIATLAWGIDNTISQQLSLRDPIQIATAKAAGASGPMLILTALLGQHLPPLPQVLAILLIGALGYGVSIWLDLLALRALGAAREAVIFAMAPFGGALFSLLVLGEALSPALALAAGLMAAGMALLLREQHNHWHQHDALRHAHRHRHDPRDGDLHHEHSHTPADLAGVNTAGPFWHAHDHHHQPTAHTHPHVSDGHHRHRH